MGKQPQSVAEFLEELRSIAQQLQQKRLAAKNPCHRSATLGLKGPAAAAFAPALILGPREILSARSSATAAAMLMS